MTLHLTHTGPYAGRPFCGAPRNPTDHYEHLAYGRGAEARLADPALCQSCRWAYEDRCARCGGEVAEDAVLCLCVGCEGQR